MFSGWEISLLIAVIMVVMLVWKLLRSQDFRASPDIYAAKAGVVSAASGVILAVLGIVLASSLQEAQINFSKRQLLQEKVDQVEAKFTALAQSIEELLLKGFLINVAFDEFSIEDRMSGLTSEHARQKIGALRPEMNLALQQLSSAWQRVMVSFEEVLRHPIARAVVAKHLKGNGNVFNFMNESVKKYGRDGWRGANLVISSPEELLGFSRVIDAYLHDPVRDHVDNILRAVLYSLPIINQTLDERAFSKVDFHTLSTFLSVGMYLKDFVDDVETNDGHHHVRANVGAALLYNLLAALPSAEQLKQSLTNYEQFPSLRELSNVSNDVLVLDPSEVLSPRTRKVIDLLRDRPKLFVMDVSVQKERAEK